MAKTTIERFKKLKADLKKKIPGEKEIIDSAKKPEDLLALVAKYKGLVAELKKEMGRSSELDKAIKVLVNLRLKLSRFYREQQKMALDEHWKKISAENVEVMRDTREQLERVRKANEEFFDNLDLGTGQLRVLRDEWSELQKQIQELDREIQESKERILNSKEVQELDHDMNEGLQSVLGKEEMQNPAVPKPSFKGCLKEMLEEREHVPKDFNEFTNDFSRRMRRFFDMLEEYAEAKVEMRERVLGIRKVRDIHINRFADPSNESSISLFKQAQSHWDFVKKSTLKLEKQSGSLRLKIGEILDQDVKVALTFEEEPPYKSPSPFPTDLKPRSG